MANVRETVNIPEGYTPIYVCVTFRTYVRQDFNEDLKDGDHEAHEELRVEIENDLQVEELQLVAVSDDPIDVSKLEP